MKKHWIMLWMLAVSQLEVQAMATTIHKWTDAKGVVHYGEQMPVDMDVKNAKSLVNPAKNSLGSEHAAVDKAPDSTASQGAKYSAANKNLSARDIAICNATNQALQDAQKNNVMMQNGQPVTLTPAQRDRAISMSKEILTYCDRK